jgi:hypothetical protein
MNAARRYLPFTDRVDHFAAAVGAIACPCENLWSDCAGLFRNRAPRSRYDSIASSGKSFLQPSALLLLSDGLASTMSKGSMIPSLRFVRAPRSH